jgi:chromate transporter
MRDVAVNLLKLGATAYGGPAIMGIMQAELQEKRQWVTKERFVEGLSLVNLLPGATAVQLGIFLGYARAGWRGGVLGGLCFVLPGFAIMLALTLTYASLGVTPIMRGALYGLGPVVLGIYVVAVYRLGKAMVGTRAQVVVAIAAPGAMFVNVFGIAAILLLAGGTGLVLFHSRRLGAIVLGVVLTLLAVAHVFSPPAAPLPVVAATSAGPHAAGLAEVGALLFKIGALTFGGGLTMIAFIQDQVVNQHHWLTPQEFIDGLSLGQFTPGPILMVAAYVGYKVAGIAGAAVGAGAVFLPSFVLMLAILPAFDRVRKLRWMRPAMRGIGPAVIGVLAVSLVQLAPHAVPDRFAIATLIATVKLMLAGAVLGILRGRLFPLRGVKAAIEIGLGAKG